VPVLSSRRGLQVLLLVLTMLVMVPVLVVMVLLLELVVLVSTASTAPSNQLTVTDDIFKRLYVANLLPPCVSLAGALNSKEL
jgi:hypothetical protein